MRLKGILALLAVLLLAAPLPAPSEAGNQNESEETEMRITITVGEREFTAALEDSETARAFAALLPMTLDMTELNGNEKYHYLMSGLPSAPEAAGQIEAGDLMLFGSECVVLFYENFSTRYTYTRLGRIDDVTGLREALGRSGVSVAFALK